MIQEKLYEKYFSRVDKRAYLIISFIIVSTLFVIVGKIFFPGFFSAVLSFIWFTFFSMVVVFIGLGVLVLVGLKNEVNQMLDLLLEGSLTIIDFINFLRILAKRFVQQLMNFLMYVAPLFSYAIALLFYLIIISFYKFIGSKYDVTLLTILITILLVAVIGIMHKPKDSEDNIKHDWFSIFIKKIKSNFTDAFEVMLFIFFLTMERTDLFFLPKGLNVELNAKINSYDLMHRGLSLDDSSITVTIIVIAISIEIIRNLIRLIVVAYREYFSYFDINENILQTSSINKTEVLKNAIRKSFYQSKDDILKFITFTTFLILVFLLFPRLKLLAMAVASMTSLILDIAIPERLYQVRGEDLISRVLFRFVKIK